MKENRKRETNLESTANKCKIRPHKVLDKEKKDKTKQKKSQTKKTQQIKKNPTRSYLNLDYFYLFYPWATYIFLFPLAICNISVSCTDCLSGKLNWLLNLLFFFFAGKQIKNTPNKLIWAWIVLEAMDGYELPLAILYSTMNHTLGYVSMFMQQYYFEKTSVPLISSPCPSHPQFHFCQASLAGKWEDRVWEL